MNLRDVGSETSVNDSVQTNEMINKRLKCSTTTPVVSVSDAITRPESAFRHLHGLLYIYLTAQS
jgi:hypothetical protein